jgi:hypothetical protein
MTDRLPDRRVLWWLEDPPPSVVVRRTGMMPLHTCPACGIEGDDCVIEAVETLDLETQRRTGLRMAYTVRCRWR